MANAKKGTLVHLSKSDMRRMPKPRAGFEAYATQLIELARSESALRSKSFDADEVLNELHLYQGMQSEVAEAIKQLALLRETRLQHASNVWRAMLRIYEHAQAEAKDDPNVQYAIAAFGAFMKQRPRKASSAAPVTTVPTAATPTSSAA